jgi:hypothetical protein
LKSNTPPPLAGVVVKSRNKRAKKAAASDYKGYFSVTILINVEEFKNKIIKLVLHNPNNNFY